MKKLKIRKINQILQNNAVQRAWIFGSYARNEETKNSDIDIIVQFLPDKKVTLFDLGGIVYDLEQTTGKKVDLVEDGSLLPYAEITANKDKKLIYERGN